MSNYPACVTETIEMLRMIEKAVVEDGLADSNPGRAQMQSFIEAQRHRVANAVRIYCAHVRPE